MNEILEIIKYTLPALILFGTVWIIMRNMLEKESGKYKFELLAGNQKYVTPVRLQSYERIILLLERISVESMALRLQKPKMKSAHLQMLMLSTVRKEFNHNLSQQLYISSEAWTAVKYAKEQILRTVNVTASKTDPRTSATEFSKALMEVYSEIETRPIEAALEVIKREARRYFGM